MVSGSRKATPNKCDPEYWFLGSDDDGNEYDDDEIKDLSEVTDNNLSKERNDKLLTEKEIMELLGVTDDQILKARSQGWRKRNDPTDPMGWHLPEPRKHLLKPYTEGNEVIALIDGKNYMNDLYDELEKLRNAKGPFEKQPFVLMAGWEFTSRKKLISLTKYNVKLNGEDGSELDAVLGGLSEVGIPLRLLAYDNPSPGINNNDLVDKLNEKASEN